MRVYFYVVIGVIIEFWQIAEKLFLSSTLRNHITLKLKLSRETYKPWIYSKDSAMASISSAIVSFMVFSFGEYQVKPRFAIMRLWGVFGTLLFSYSTKVANEFS